MPETKILANKDAEQSILGSVFFDESIIRLIKDKVQVKDFYYLRHQEIYQAMLDLFLRHNPVDTTTVISLLEDKGKLNECGGAEYILELLDAVPSVSNVEAYIDIVKDKSVQRSVVKVCNDIIKESNEDIEDSRVFLDNVEKKIFNATSERTTKDLVFASPVIDNAIQKIRENAQREGDITGIDTGFPELNKYSLGLQNSELIILAARPSMGKTALALNMAANIAQLPSRPYVAFFSLEMGLEQLAFRMLSSVGHVNQSEMKKGRFSQDTAWEKINYAASKLRDTNLMFDESGSVSIQDLRSICRKKKSEGKLDVVFIDYLQLLGSRTRNDSRVQEVSEISRALKEMARELNIPVVALSQLSRSLEARQDKKPIMSDLRESGSIEQDADIVMFIYRDEYYTKEASEKPGIAEIIVAKNRNGIIGNFELLFNSSCTSFENKEN